MAFAAGYFLFSGLLKRCFCSSSTTGWLPETPGTQPKQSPPAARMELIITFFFILVPASFLLLSKQFYNSAAIESPLERNPAGRFNHRGSNRSPFPADHKVLDTPTAKARGILEKSDCLRNPYSQRACQQPSTQSFKAEVLFTFLCNVARSVDVCVNERVFFGTVQSPFDAFA